MAYLQPEGGDFASTWLWKLEDKIGAVIGHLPYWLANFCVVSAAVAVLILFVACVFGICQLILDFAAEVTRRLVSPFF